MTKISDEVWVRLGGILPKGEDLSARTAAPETTRDLYAAIDSGGRRHLLVVCGPGEESVHDEHSRGIGVATRDLTVRDVGKGRYIDIVCLDPSGHDGFDVVAGEIAAGLAATTMPRGDLVSRVLAKWRRFWSESAGHVLTREEILGLFGELWFLSVWFLPRVGTGEALRRWRGPFDARHDFEWLGGSVEVKTTSSSGAHTHHVHGIDQLALPETGWLEFFSLRVREEAGASNTLPGLVGIVSKALEGDAEATTLFETALAARRYSLSHEDEYAKHRLRVVDERLFRVESDFPRIVASSFNAGVPKSVDHIEYDINLSGLEHLLIATSREGLPEGWPDRPPS